MSVEYGLGLHLQAIEDSLEQLMQREYLDTTRVWADPPDRQAGRVVARALADPEAPDEDLAALAPRLGAVREVTLLDERKLLRFSQPVSIKGALRGHLIAYTRSPPSNGQPAAATRCAPRPWCWPTPASPCRPRHRRSSSRPT
jgi:hypothetical protein